MKFFTALTLMSLFGSVALCQTPVNIDSAVPGQTFELNGHKITVVEKDITPVVNNEFSKRGIYEKADNTKLQQFRQQEKFNELIAGSKDEFEQMVRIVDWAQKRLPKFGTPTSKASSPVDIVKAADEGNTFFCNHFACIFIGATASMGWPSRTLALHYGNNPHKRGAPEHSAAEVWSDQYRKWILFDPLFGLYIERDGIPLNAWEVRQEWYYGNRNKLTFVLGVDRKKSKHTDKSILIGMHPGFGPLEFNQRAYADKFALYGNLQGNNLI